MPASYPTSAKAFTTKVDGAGNTILAAHINDLQAEVTAVETDLIAGLPLARGGTGLTSLTANRIPYSSGSAFTSAAGFTFDGSLATVPALTSPGDIYTTALTDYTATSTIVGWSSFTAGRKFIYYKKVGKTVYVLFWLEGVSNATGVTFTLPVAPTGTTYPVVAAALGYTFDNGAAITTPGHLELLGGATTVTIYKDSAAGAWTNSGDKKVGGQFFYETA